MKLIKKRTGLAQYKYWITPYAFIMPFYITFFIFLLWPAIFALFVSMTNWMGGAQNDFIGLQNYYTILSDKQFYQSLYNTFYLTFFSLLFVIPSSLIAAIIFDLKWFKARKIYRVIFFAPIATTPIAISLVFVGLLDTNYGVINYFLKLISLEAIPWLEKAEWIKPAIILIVFWRSIGLYMIYFLAGLQGIPDELNEAAIIDGAGPFRIVWNIILPILRPVILFVVVIATIDLLQLFDESVMLNKFTHSTGGAAGPSDAGLTMAFYLYRHGIGYFKMGYGSAVGILIFIIVSFFAIIQMKSLSSTKG